MVKTFIKFSVFLIITGFFIANFVCAEDMGIRKSALDKEIVNLPEASEPNSAKLPPAGKAKTIKKPYFTAPPQTPHSVKEYLPITQKSNMCINCHKPDSHFYNPRTGQKLSHLFNGMYNCSMCHTPQQDVSLPVKNNFKKMR